VGDAAHIVPPTGAKGLNLAASDAHYLSEALIEYFHKNSNAGIKQYSSQALSRIWKAERFSWGLTNLLHRFPGQTGFDQKMQEAEFSYLKSSENARRVLAENYVGLPY
jgi:p-hydroxybenzoate 3-monooxygenase